MKYVLVLLVGFITLTACDQQSDDELFQPSTEEVQLFVSAAISLSDALVDIVDAFEETHPYIDITVNFGGSGTLSRQIQQGAPVDVFLSADQLQMDLLKEQDLIMNETRTDFTENQLVLIAGKDSIFDIHSLDELPFLDAERMAIANPDSVPAGNYAEEALRNSNVWDRLSDQFIYAKDVRQVLTYVESGNTEIGFVYSSDVMQSDTVDILTEIDPSLHEQIAYPAAVTTNSANSIEAAEFVEFLKSDTAAEIFEVHGFR